MKEYKQVKIYLDDERKAWLKAYALEKELSVSQLIRQMIDLFEEVLKGERDV